MSDIIYLRQTLERKKGQYSQIQKIIKETKNQIKVLKQQLIHHEKAQEIIKQVGLMTQKQLQVHISDIVTLALEAVFPDPYILQVDFVERRNRTECDLFFLRNDERIDPITASGGGAVDVASFALRVASWSMARPGSRNTIILDEPLRFLSQELQSKAASMIKEISKQLGVQFIIITHEKELASYADKIFTVTKPKQYSLIS